VATLAATTVAAQPAATAAQSGGSVLAIGVVADGKPIAARTLAPGQVARFSLAGRGGQRVTIVQRSSQGNPGPSSEGGCATNATRLVAPGGRQLAREINCGLLPAIALPSDGTYLIEVSSEPTDLVDLLLSIFDVPPDVTATLTVGGPPVAVTTSAPGQRAQLELEGRAGQRIGLVQRTADGATGPNTQPGCWNETTRLLRSDRQEIASTSSCAPLAPTRLPADGVYTVEVSMLDASTADLTLEAFEQS